MFLFRAFSAHSIVLLAGLVKMARKPLFYVSHFHEVSYRIHVIHNRVEFGDVVRPVGTLREIFRLDDFLLLFLNTHYLVLR